MSRLVLVGVVLSAAMVVTIVVLIRRRYLRERHAILWLVAALAIIVFAVWTDAQRALADVVGIAYPPSALFLLVLLLLGVVLLDSIVTISRLAARVQTLAQRVALLGEELDRQAQALAERDAEKDEAPAPLGVDGP